MRARSDIEKMVASRAQSLRAHANLIGRMCIAWSSLEMDLAVLLSTLAEISDPKTKNVLIGLLDMPEKVRACLALGFALKPNDVWFDRLQKALRQTSDQLRPERNRMVHDTWLAVPET